MTDFLQSQLGIDLNVIRDIDAHMQAHFPPSYREVMSPAEEMVGSMYARTAFFDQEDRLIGLNLYGCGLQDAQLAFLQQQAWPQLIALNLAKNEITHFAFSDKLTGLVVADLSQNPALAKLRCEAGLDQLARLELFRCDLRKLSIPSSYRALFYLDLSRNQAFEEINFLGQAPELQVLMIRGTRLRSFCLKEGFSKLVHLYLNDNQLEHFEVEGTAYPQLLTLQLKNNKLKALALDILSGMPKLDGLYLGGNEDLPTVLYAEIEGRVRQNHLSEFKAYRAAMAQGQPQKNNECKVLLIGNGYAGKTNLASRITFGPFNPEWATTHGILLKQKQLGDYLINYWDFGGQNIYHSTHRLFMQKDAVYILVWSEDTLPQGEAEAVDYQDKNHPLHYWLEYAYSLGEDSPILVVQTKIGKDHENLRELEASLTEKYDTLFSFFRVHAVESDNRGYESGEAQELFDHDSGYVALRKLVLEAVETIRKEEEIPLPYYRLRSLIRAEQEKGRQTMSRPEYLALAESLRQEDPPLSIDNPDGLLTGWLFKSGVVYFRPDRFSDQIILNQSWAIDAIYTLFNRREFLKEDSEYSIPALIERKNGRFSGQFLREVWDRKRYSHAHQEVFVGFMKSCDLCFEIEAEGKNTSFEDRVFIAPQLLRDIKPPEMEDLGEWGQPLLEYCYEDRFLHEGIMYAFIAHTAYQAEIKNIWRRGIKIQEGQGASLQLAYVEASQTQITVKLSPNAGPLLAKIRNLIGKLLPDGKGREFLAQAGGPPIDLTHAKEGPFPILWEAKGRRIPLPGDAEEGLTDPRLESSFESNRSKVLSGEDYEIEKEQAQALPPEKQILFCSASPRNLSRIAHHQEFLEAYSELTRRDQYSRFGFIDPPLKATGIQELLDAFDPQPQIIHFAGHGKEEGLFLEEEDGGAILLSIAQVPRVFERLKGITELVLLNACSSQSMARAISLYDIHVIGTQFPIKNQPAISFAKGFYAGLGRSQSDSKQAYREAYNDGIITVESEHPEVAGIYEVWYQGKSLSW